MDKELKDYLDNESLIYAAEDYVWPEPIEDLPGFGEAEAFKARCREYYAFIAGAKWRENQIPDIRVEARNTRNRDIDILIDGERLNGS